MITYNNRTNNANISTAWSDNGDGNYVKVYFRINTKGFACAYGFFEEMSDKEAFNKEASDLIKSFGIVESCGYHQNNEYLHARPQQISGIVAKSKVKDIAEAINKSNTMTIRYVNVYNEYVYMEDAEYIEILNSKRQEIAGYIVEKSATKRISQFYSCRDIAVNVQEKFKVNRINAIEDINTHKTTFKYALEIIKRLVENGYLIQTKDNTYIRSLNKTEQKKRKINYDNISVMPISLS